MRYLYLKGTKIGSSVAVSFIECLHNICQLDELDLSEHGLPLEYVKALSTEMKPVGNLVVSAKIIINK